MSRGLKVPEITTAMATAAYVDLGTDSRLWRRRNGGRNKRLAFLVALVAGSFVGAFLMKERGPRVTMAVAAIVKTVAMGVVVLVRAEGVETKEIV